jgi:tRNA A-37 threonylcarbamoyl transferase component Bud32
MSWPTPQDYNEAMQSPWLNLNDRALKSGKPALDFLGLPRPMTGAFASVYKLECDGKAHAVKLFLRNIPDQHHRYSELSNSINSKELHHTVGFQYQPEGINIIGKNYPILKMDWVDGENLDQYVMGHLSEPGALSLLLHHFRSMAKNLNKSGVAHGDLQHGNIIVQHGELKLVDYDGMYVSKLKGMKSNELGHPNFQHPGRSSNHFGPYLDNFSCWAIQTSLLSISVDPTLWDKLSAGDDCLLFRRADFEKPLESDAFKLLENHDSEPVRTNAKLLRYILMYPPEHVPPLDENIMHVNHLPAMRAPEIITNAPIDKNFQPFGSSGDFADNSHNNQSEATTAVPYNSNLPDWMQPGPTAQPKPRAQAADGSSPWPRFEQYRQVFGFTDLGLYLTDQELQTGRFMPETKGLGTKGFVFHMRCASRHVAVKCFRDYIPDRHKRFEAIKRYVNSAARRYFIDFDYLPEGIRVGNLWYPTLKMEWLPTTLGEYINQNMRNRARLAALFERFMSMVQALQILGIAHGDLEPDNIMVVGGDLKLVDYDGMFVPELDGLSGIETGHPAFQHPGRQPDYFGPDLDYFSAWILSAELSYLKVDPMLWAQAEIRSQAAVAKTSRMVHDATFLDTHPSKSVKHTGDVLRKLLDYDFHSIPRFDPNSPIYSWR